MKVANQFVYKAVRKDCVGRSNEWCMQAVNEILGEMTKQIDETGKAPEAEQLNRIESVLQALKDELRERGIE